MLYSNINNTRVCMHIHTHKGGWREGGIGMSEKKRKKRERDSLEKEKEESEWWSVWGKLFQTVGRA